MPVLKILLQRDGQSAVWMRVRFPEYIDAWHNGKNFRIYRDGRAGNIASTLACEPVKLPVEWQGTPQNLGYSMAFDNGMVFEAVVMDRRLQILAIAKESLVISPSPDRSDEGIYRWTAPADLDASILAIVSEDNSWSIATASDNASPIWSNPDLSCMHSSPSIAFCKAGETAHLTIDLHFVEGGIEALKAYFFMKEE